jgi:hypothetical protein
MFDQPGGKGHLSVESLLREIRLQSLWRRRRIELAHLKETNLEIRATMDRRTIYFFITVTLYFLLLHKAILPALKKFSIRVQGAPFDYRLRGSSAEKDRPKHAKYDMLWSFLANALALIVSMIPFGIVEELGYGAVWFGT